MCRAPKPPSRIVAWVATLLLAPFAGAVPPQDPPPSPQWPGKAADGSILLTNGWKLTPHGAQYPLASDLPVRAALHPAGRWLAIQHAGYRQHQVVLFDTAANRIGATLPLPRTWSGMAWAADGRTLYASGGADDVVRAVPFDAAAGVFGEPAVWPLGVPETLDLPAGLAAAADQTLFVCLQRTGLLVHLGRDGAVLGNTPLGADSFPFECVLAADGGTAYVSLWAKAQVAVVDARSGAVRGTIATGDHPSELLLHPDGLRLFVSNGNENTVTVVDLRKQAAVETIGSALHPDAPPGSTPNSLALAGNLLLVANADNNTLAVVDVHETGHSRSLGFVPTGWYPTTVRTSRDGRTVFVGNGKGSLGSHANPDGPHPDKKRKTADDYTGSMFAGSLAVFGLPAPTELAKLSAQAVGNSPLRPAGGVRGLQGRPADSPIPARPGEPSPIRHVVYVIKENRTYDQVFGDLPQGNGEPKLCLFPREVTPNHHAIAEQFVLLDNFYVESEVSADGHEWTMGAYATDFVERTWPVSYGGKGSARTPEGAEVVVGYPGEGNFALGVPKNGYLWDLAKAKGLDYRSYGEWVQNAADPAQPGRPRSPALEGHCDVRFRSFDLEYPDCRRIDRFAEELAECERRGTFPALTIVRLPQDHTAGTKVGAFTPRSCLADNDLALGRLFDLLSHSRFWPAMALFVVEDDAQNGPDHVDAHRTVGLVAGPHVRRSVVVSTQYSTCSMLRTMELILGLPPMSQFDAAALPMFDCFQGAADPRPFTALPARVPLDERNGRTAWGAARSATFDLTREDAADDLLLNEVVWHAVKGPGEPMPPPRRAAFVRQFADD